MLVLKKLAVVLTHPVQYYAPLFRLLCDRGYVILRVFYTWEQWQYDKYDWGFGKNVEWDIPLLEGYDYQFVKNDAVKPGIHHFFGLNNKNLIEAIKQFKADAVWIFGWNYLSHVKTINYFKGKIPVFFRGDSHLLDRQTAFKLAARKLIISSIYKKIDYFLYVGTYNRAYFKYFGAKDHQLVYTPHAIENQRFFDNAYEDYKKQAYAWREKLGIQSGERVILFAGKFEKKKAPDLLIKAFLNVSHDNIKLIMAGNGEMENELKAMAGNDQRILFLPFQNQKVMPVVYRLADFFILPSRGPGETWGLAVNESLASGIPVILSNKAGSAPDLVDQHKNGFVFSSEDETALKEIIEKCAAIREKDYLMMQSAALDKIGNFSFENIAAPVEHLMDHISYDES